MNAVFETKFVLSGHKMLMPQDVDMRNNINENLRLFEIINLKNIVNQKLNCNLNFLNYNILVEAIPKNWKNILKGNEFMNFQSHSEDVCLKVNNKLCTLLVLKNKNIFTEIISRK